MQETTMQNDPMLTDEAPRELSNRTWEFAKRFLRNGPGVTGATIVVVMMMVALLAPLTHPTRPHGDDRTRADATSQRFSTSSGPITSAATCSPGLSTARGYPCVSPPWSSFSPP